MPDPRTGLPNTINEWERAKRQMQPAPQPRQDPRTMLANVLAKVRTGPATASPGEGMIPFSALPRSVREAAAGALTTQTEAPIGFAPSDFTDPHEREILNRLVALGQKEQEPTRLKAEQEAEAKMQADQALLAQR